MIKVIIKPELLEKHRKYLINKNINERLRNFQKNENFFEIEYLNELVKANIKKKQEYSVYDFFLKEITSKEQKTLLQQHIGFVDYLMKEVNGLKSCKEFSDCNNLFLANPGRLNEKEKYIEQNFRDIYEFLKLQSKIQNKNKSEKKEHTYASYLRECLGYSEFSNEKMNYFYKYELEKIKSLREIGRYKDKLMLPEAPRPYPVGNLNSIKQYILEDINEINHYDKENEVLNEFLQTELQQKIKELPVAKDTGNSIGITEFGNKVKSIINNAYDTLKTDKKFQSIGITTRNIDIYNAKYETEWGAYHFLMELGIKSCPYCNRQYISPMYSENGKVRADLDHFYNKATYPYFSISIFNLVPSCKFCNSSLKGMDNFEFDTNLSPYEDGFGDRLKFSFEVKSYGDFLGDSKVRIYLQDNIGNSEEERRFLDKAKENLEAFQIENLYNYHTDEAIGLIRKRIEYSDVYIGNLINSYNEKLFRSENEVIEALLGYQVEDEKLLEKNLTKFTRDICEEIGFVFRKGIVKSNKDIQLIIDKYKK
ncbi:hypothetical protein BTH38_23460 [Bacillus toyonensis]|uniref:hypothetical protein n=1 Tax=Bacillus toyonensis TaxID=155322 RepID=UPI000A19D14A|nr:hypothetical protein [Bacillus toyonensis]OSM10723.1 hypothetical protein BTH38_23460 [Bacillus toyonensis]